MIVTAYLRIHFDIHLRQRKSIQYVCLSFLTALKVEKRIKGITAYPRIQLYQGYSFEVAGYSAVTPTCVSWRKIKRHIAFLLRQT